MFVFGGEVGKTRERERDGRGVGLGLGRVGSLGWVRSSGFGSRNHTWAVVERLRYLAAIPRSNVVYILDF